MANRREFIHSLAGLTALAAACNVDNLAAQNVKTPFSCNSYTWATFYGRDNKNWGENLDACIAEFAQSGITAYEPGLSTAKEALDLMPVLKKYGITMPSVYVNSTMHEAGESENSIKNVLAIADAVQGYGTKIMVTNPNPIRWGGDELKTDEQLQTQAAAMEKLGVALKKRGITLAYHTHAPEFMAGAREFHHVLLNTDPAHVSFCFDVHWVFRGSMDSKVAVFDVLKLYGDRVAELHVRQSKGGVWTETFTEGDIDYARFVRELKARQIFPHIVIEQAVEAKTPHTLSALAAHKEMLGQFKKVFAPLMD
jgi:inosose dehydratase